MFAPKLFQTRTKQAAPSVGLLVLRPPALAGARSAPAGVQQALMLQRLVGNQATMRLLAKRSMRRSRQPGSRDNDTLPVEPIAPLRRAADLSRLGPDPLHATPAIVGRAPADAQEILAPPSILSSTATPGPTSSANLPPPESRRMIRQGSRGEEVRYAQQRLNDFGASPPLAVDGIFGPLTRAATIDYQKTHGLGPDAIIGPRTWASLDGPTVIGGDTGAGGGGAGGPGSPLLYSTGTQQFNPPAPGATMASIRAEIKAKQDLKPQPDLGKTVDVKGVTVGQPEEIFVWNVLLQRAQRQFWGGQIEVVTQIGPPPKGGGAAPVGQIVIKIDGNGNATAELINRGSVAVPTTFPDKPSAIAALKVTFGFASVDNGTASWSLTDLNKVHAALLRLPTADRAALAGVQLVRDNVLTDKDGKPLSGEFRHEASVTPGSAGVPSVATRSESLHLADSAFSGDAISFVGDKSNAAVASFHTILHEAGHAVETKALRDAEFAAFEAQAVVNNDILAFNAEQTKTNAAVRAANSAQHAALAKFNAYKAPDRKSSEAFVRAYQAALRAINAFANNQTASRFAAFEAAANAAIANRDAERGKLPAGHAAQGDFADAIQTQNAWFSAAQDRAKASIKLDASNTELREKKAAQAAVSDKTGKASKRLANFVDVVNKNKIPPLTDYARTNWPGHPEEFYAEAYALWLANPAFLDANAHALKAWFDAGEHLK